MGGQLVGVLVFLGKNQKVVVGKVGGGALVDFHPVGTEGVAEAVVVDEGEGAVVVLLGEAASLFVEADGPVLKEDDVDAVHGILGEGAVGHRRGVLCVHHPEFGEHPAQLALRNFQQGHQVEVATAVVGQHVGEGEDGVFRPCGKEEIVHVVAESVGDSAGFPFRFAH